jgi:hypothetical protein
MTRAERLARVRARHRGRHPRFGWFSKDDVLRVYGLDHVPGIYRWM